MTKPVGLEAPIYALCAFALIYNPMVVRHLPKTGWKEIVTSPQIFFLLSSAVIIKARRLAWNDVGLGMKNWKFDVALGFLLGLVPVILVLGLAFISPFLNPIFPFLPDSPFGGIRHSFYPLTTSLVILVLLAPVSEELFFRGIFLRAMKERYSVGTSIFTTSLLFMLAHGGFTIGPLLLGLITGAVRLRTDSIVSCMIFHSLSNLYGPVLITYFPNLFSALRFLFQ